MSSGWFCLVWWVLVGSGGSWWVLVCRVASVNSEEDFLCLALFIILALALALTWVWPQDSRWFQNGPGGLQDASTRKRRKKHNGDCRVYLGPVLGLSWAVLGLSWGCLGPVLCLPWALFVLHASDFWVFLALR
jgi:hypothetical protein